VDLSVVENKFRSLVKESMAKQGRSLRASFDAEKMRLGAVKNCGKSDDLAQDLTITLSPENPKAGDTYHTITDYTLADGVVVTSGKAYYKATLSGFPIVNQADDLCEDLKDGSTPCPLSGHIHSDDSSDMPDGVHGALSSTMRWTANIDGTEKEILCLQLQFSL